MENPWLKIPAHEYEGHMASPDVGQLQVLNDLFGSAVRQFKPRSLAVLGCSTGNGFEHISPAVTERVVGVDINPSYLAILKQRFSRRLPNISLMEHDFTSASFRMEPVCMIFAALVFEYVDTDHALHNIGKHLLPGGTLIAALQLPSRESAPVTPTQYTSLEALASIMKLVDVNAFSRTCSHEGLLQVRTRKIPLKHGKVLFVGYYEKESGQQPGEKRSPLQIYDVQTQGDKKMIEMEPIGIIHTPFLELEGMPIQPAGAAGVRGTVEVFEEFRAGLKDLEGFSHIILFYFFHRSKGFKLEVIPFLDNVSRGVFATRAPKRPNPIGISVVRLDTIENSVLHVKDVDILDGTPLLDIKPYVPEFDNRQGARTGWLEHAGSKVSKQKSDDRFK
jgi:tRNA (adenine37-N6)-methyltransferase